MNFTIFASSKSSDQITKKEHYGYEKYFDGCRFIDNAYSLRRRRE
jgi:hypothetical protein